MKIEDFEMMQLNELQFIKGGKWVFDDGVWRWEGDEGEDEGPGPGWAFD